MFHRTYGQTRNCKGCKFWSEMIARAHGGGPVEALCLATGGQYSGKYTVASTRCDKWESGENGAIDEPGYEEPSVETQGVNDGT